MIEVVFLAVCLILSVVFYDEVKDFMDKML